MSNVASLTPFVPYQRLGAITDRNARWTLLRSDGILNVTVGADPVSGEVTGARVHGLRPAARLRGAGELQASPFAAPVLGRSTTGSE